MNENNQVDICYSVWESVEYSDIPTDAYISIRDNHSGYIRLRSLEDHILQRIQELTQAIEREHSSQEPDQERLRHLYTERADKCGKIGHTG
jgi:hypothetical protein